MVRRDVPPEMGPFGDAALWVRFGDTISPRVHARVMALLAALDARRLPGIRDLTPAYASLLVQFDPLVVGHDKVASTIAGALVYLRANRRAASRLVEIPVVYGGDDGPDLEDVARLTGLSAAEVVARHAGATYRVYFLGFQAGFPYLGVLPRAIAVPRLDRPRPRVAAGSVGIAERQAGVYPAVSPGGWRILGRTNARLFDPGTDPPSLLRPGDRVRFVPAAAGGEAGESARVGRGTREGSAGGGEAAPCLRVVQPGPFTTVQDVGRWGFARYGVSRGGAADEEALRLGNGLLGNDEGAAALEITLGNCAYEALRPCTVALTGAECRAAVDGHPVARGRALRLEAGQMIEFGAAEVGVRAYLCVAGGVRVPLVLGSRSTDVRAGLGGLGGRPLRAGDAVCAGTGADGGGRLGETVGTAEIPGLDADICRDVVLRVLAGPRAREDERALDALVAGVYVVDPLSDRMGVRLRPAGAGAPGRIRGGQILSAGVPRGAVQTPPGGEPIVLMVDAQTTGGYAVPAVVITADLGRLGQLRPGDRVRFARVTLEDALDALRERQGRLCAALDEGRRRAWLDELLRRGFAEWSEAADPRR